MARIKSDMSMNKLLSALLLPLLSVGLTAAFSAEPGNVRITFVQPERFSDFRIQGRQENASAEIFRDQVSAYLSPSFGATAFRATS